MIKESIRIVTNKGDLTQEQAAMVMGEIMSGQATPAQIGAILTALCIKGETVQEITGFAQMMREKSVKISPKVSAMIDTCGTGGDASGTFNISTAAAFVVSAAGIAVAKHGNRSVSSKSGSADVLEALGVKIDISPQATQQCIEQIGIGFMCAPRFHQAMKYAAAPRKELGVRTVFNILGPLTNPANAKCQLLGVFDKKLTQIMAQVLASLGTKRAMVVHGKDGLDEITISGETYVSELNQGSIKNYTISPEQFGLKTAELKRIAGGDSETNAEIIRSVLGTDIGPKSDIVALNAGAAIYLCDGAESMTDGIKIAQQVLCNGSALKRLEEMVALTNTIE